MTTAAGKAKQQQVLQSFLSAFNDPVNGIAAVFNQNGRQLTAAKNEDPASVPVRNAITAVNLVGNALIKSGPMLRAALNAVDAIVVSDPDPIPDPVPNPTGEFEGVLTTLQSEAAGTLQLSPEAPTGFGAYTGYKHQVWQPREKTKVMVGGFGDYSSSEGNGSDSHEVVYEFDAATKRFTNILSQLEAGCDAEGYSKSITGLELVSKGSGYKDGYYLGGRAAKGVPISGGSGKWATIALQVVGGQVIGSNDQPVSMAHLQNVGQGFEVGELLSVPDSELGGAGGSGFQLKVTSVSPVGVVSPYRFPVGRCNPAWAADSKRDCFWMTAGGYRRGPSYPGGYTPNLLKGGLWAFRPDAPADKKWSLQGPSPADTQWMGEEPYGWWCWDKVSDALYFPYSQFILKYDLTDTPLIPDGVVRDRWSAIVHGVDDPNMGSLQVYAHDTKRRRIILYSPGTQKTFAFNIATGKTDLISSACPIPPRFTYWLHQNYDIENDLVVMYGGYDSPAPTSVTGYNQDYYVMTPDGKWSVLKVTGDVFEPLKSIASGGPDGRCFSGDYDPFNKGIFLMVWTMLDVGSIGLNRISMLKIKPSALPPPDPIPDPIPDPNDPAPVPDSSPILLPSLSWMPAAGARTNIGTDFIKRHDPNPLRNAVYAGIGGLNGLLSWSGAIYARAFDPMGGRFGSYVTCGGGDGDYGGNEVYLQSVEFGGVMRLTDPFSGPFFSCRIDRTPVDPHGGNLGSKNGCGGDNEWAEHWLDGTFTKSRADQPLSRHTYDMLTELPPNVGGAGPLGALLLGPAFTPVWGPGAGYMIHMLQFHTLKWERYAQERMPLMSIGTLCAGPSDVFFTCNPEAGGFMYAVQALSMATRRWKATYHPDGSVLTSSYGNQRYSESMKKLLFVAPMPDGPLFNIIDPITAEVITPVQTGTPPPYLTGTIQWPTGGGEWVEDAKTFVWYEGGGSQNVHILRPTGNLTEPWNWTVETVPNGPAPVVNGSTHHSRFRNIPSLSSPGKRIFIWIGSVAEPAQAWHLTSF